MTKHLLCTLFCALLAAAPLAAQTGLQALGEPIPDGETNPGGILVENATLDAVLLIESGDEAGAYAILDSLERSKSPDPAVQYYLGLLNYSRGDVDDAAAHLEKATQLDTANLWYRETLANLYVATGEGAKAGGILAGLAERNPLKFRNVYTLSLIADAYRLKRDYDGYFSALTSIVTDEYTSDEIKYQAIMGALGGFDKRTLNSIMPRIDTLMMRYTEAEPRSIQAHTLRMETAGTIGDKQTLIDECLALIGLAPDDIELQTRCLTVIGDTLHEMGDNRSAYRYYEKAIKLDPKCCTALNNYAYFLSLEGKRLCKAARMSRITVEEEPDNATYLDTYGWILYLRHKPAKAKPYFKHAMLYGGKDSAVVLMHYSLVLSALGENELATYYRNLAESKSK